MREVKAILLENNAAFSHVVRNVSTWAIMSLSSNLALPGHSWIKTFPIFFWGHSRFLMLLLIFNVDSDKISKFAISVESNSLLESDIEV